MTVPDDAVPLLAYDVVERNGPQRRLLLLLHGYGESAAPLVERLDMFDPGGECLVVVPRAPFEHDGQRMWHRSIRHSDGKPQYFASVAALDRLLDDLERQTGAARTEAIVGGFSQGGGVAAGLLAVAHITPPAAVFGICTFVPKISAADGALATGTRARVLLIAATEDLFPSIEFAPKGAERLAAVGCAVTYLEVGGGHEVTDESARHVAEWLTSVLSTTDKRHEREQR